MNILTSTDKLVTSCKTTEVWRLRLKRAFNLPKYRKILNLLDYNEEITVEDVADKISSSKSLTSQDLTKLKEVGLVKYDTEGKYHIYSINKPIMRKTLIMADVMRAMESLPCRNPEYETEIQKIIKVIDPEKKISWSPKAKNEFF